jgi:hypothetical protein
VVRVEEAARVQGDRQGQEEERDQEVGRAEPAQPEAGQVREDPRVGERADLGAGLVAPADRDLGDGPAAPVQMLEDLHVDAPAVETGGGEGLAGLVAVEQLETALGVLDTGHRGGPYQQVPGAAEQLAQPVLVVGYLRARHRARAYRRHVALAERLVEPLQLLDRSREIGVGDQHPAAAAGGDAQTQGVALAPVAVTGDQTDVRVI